MLTSVVDPLWEIDKLGWIAECGIQLPELISKPFLERIRYTLTVLMIKNLQGNEIDETFQALLRASWGRELLKQSHS